MPPCIPRCIPPYTPRTCTVYATLLTVMGKRERPLWEVIPVSLLGRKENPLSHHPFHCWTGKRALPLHPFHCWAHRKRALPPPVSLLDTQEESPPTTRFTVGHTERASHPRFTVGFVLGREPPSLPERGDPAEKRASQPPKTGQKVKKWSIPAFQNGTKRWEMVHSSLPEGVRKGRKGPF